MNQFVIYTSSNRKLCLGYFQNAVIMTVEVNVSGVGTELERT